MNSASKNSPEREKLIIKHSFELKTIKDNFEFKFFLILNFLKRLENEFWLADISGKKILKGAKPRLDKRISSFLKSIKEKFISIFSGVKHYIINVCSFVPICSYRFSLCENLSSFLKSSGFFLLEIFFFPLVIIDSQRKINDVVLMGYFGKKKENLFCVLHQKKAIVVKTLFQNFKKNKKCRSWQLKKLKTNQPFKSNDKFLEKYQNIVPFDPNSIFFFKKPDSKSEFDRNRDYKKDVFRFPSFSKTFLFFSSQKGFFLNTRSTNFFFFFKKRSFFHIKFPRFLKGSRERGEKLKKNSEIIYPPQSLTKKFFNRILTFFSKKNLNILSVSHMSFTLISGYQIKKKNYSEINVFEKIRSDGARWETFLRINFFGASNTRIFEKVFFIKDFATFEILLFEKSFFFISSQIFIDYLDKASLLRFYCSIHQNLYLDSKLLKIFLKKLLTSLIFQTIVREIIQNFSGELIFELSLTMLVFLLNTKFLEISLGKCELILITYIIHCCFYVFFICSSRKKILVCFLYKLLKKIQLNERILDILKKNII